MNRKIESLVIASHNSGKVREIRALLAPLGVAVRSAAELGLPEPEETEDSFIGNALLKARAAGRAHVALADDSGLAVDALGGAPGIFSARWAGPSKDFALAMDKVREALPEHEREGARARFVCVLALAFPDGAEEAFEGVVEGRLTFPPRGGNGFGYDPIFIPDGFDRTFGEMLPEEKQPLTHRAKAFAKLTAWLAS